MGDGPECGVGGAVFNFDIPMRYSDSGGIEMRCDEVVETAVYGGER